MALAEPRVRVKSLFGEELNIQGSSTQTTGSTQGPTRRRGRLAERRGPDSPGPGYARNSYILQENEIGPDGTGASDCACAVRNGFARLRHPPPVTVSSPGTGAAAGGSSRPVGCISFRGTPSRHRRGRSAAPSLSLRTARPLLSPRTARAPCHSRAAPLSSRPFRLSSQPPNLSSRAPHLSSRAPKLVVPDLIP